MDEYLAGRRGGSATRLAQRPAGHAGGVGGTLTAQLFPRSREKDGTGPWPARFGRAAPYRPKARARIFAVNDRWVESPPYPFAPVPKWALSDCKPYVAVAVWSERGRSLYADPIDPPG